MATKKKWKRRAKETAMWLGEYQETMMTYIARSMMLEISIGTVRGLHSCCQISYTTNGEECDCGATPVCIECAQNYPCNTVRTIDAMHNATDEE